MTTNCVQRNPKEPYIEWVKRNVSNVSEQRDVIKARIAKDQRDYDYLCQIQTTWELAAKEYEKDLK